MKKELRKEIIKKRDELDCTEKTIKDKKIIEKLKDTKEYKEAKGIFVYIGFGSEINTKILIEDALEDGKEVCVPKVIKKDMVFIKINSLENLVTSSYGILEPVGDKNNFNVDNLGLIIMPGLAFDKQGNRLGYGGGYYDKFLSNNKINVKKIALAYDFQILDKVPSEEHDIKVDSIITEEKEIEINNKK
ncbi:5-formyltetrahydrofolate cyclo-ligase [Clostridium baratii]|uniref:5-formyltetrahydrofolate cyclo-ligase n=1 Tax=Clostridium baratii str. Sullivan TaxID=1415775 RepID=A0A0A7G1M5_9CLOT|nr:5-formyltetrahydrofolate cyclo-ligase [Clostridium baratii]AIY84915.1 5-formyltetrahydrofolate cyclo-ligase [Clostridium baratii str. Sullivan]MDU1054795.1 5-formyltetrahydrofolate cyclo-ligase [Clostridium baratii]MDU4911926.1 5-formyltetrahydrofolate cyclo-ligase [Clostridium baratii]CUP67435.1 5-formyltetrahydrofolate cyclo-ligase [Clostridium baratii]